MMLEGLTRFEYEPSDEYTFLGQLLPDDYGDWVRYADVADAYSAKLAEIRAAVEAERGEVETLFRAHDVPDTGQVLRPWWTKQYALDALLAVIP